jgi:hypothetical protein
MRTHRRIREIKRILTTLQGRLNLKILELLISCWEFSGNVKCGPDCISITKSGGLAMLVRHTLDWTV